MDYDIVDGGTRPRLQVQSGGQQGSGEEDQLDTTLSKVYAGIFATVGIVSVGLGLSVLAGVWQFVVVWLGLSLVLGPFAPPSLTGGDCSVGIGDPVLPEDGTDDSVEEIAGQGSRSQPKSREKSAPRQPVEVVNGSGLIEHRNVGNSSSEGSSHRASSDPAEVEKEWSSEDVDLLKKLMVKHPRGTLRRWEVVAEGLGGKHNVDNVVKMSKALGQKKAGGGDQDAYSRFLSQRKVTDVAIASPLSRRDDVGDQQQNGDDETEESDELTSVGGGGGGGKGKWTDAEDKALLTALKTFPKDSPMRWDKVALAVPGRSKAHCFKRFSDLRKSFRSTIGGGSASQEDLTQD